MNNSKLDGKSTVISTMASGMRSDAWHWRDSDVSQFSSEKLNSILNMPLDSIQGVDNEEDRQALDSALKQVRQELEKRAVALKAG